MADIPYSHPVTVAEVPPGGLDVELKPDAAVREGLARHAGVLAVSAFTARLKVLPEGKEGLHVTGTLDAVVRQTCGVTLEPFDAPLHEAVDVHFVPAGTAVPPVEEDSEYDPPDEIVGGTVDLGALAGEFLALGVDPYPRKPGAVFEQPADQDGAVSPFSSLARLKDRN